MLVEPGRLMLRAPRWSRDLPRKARDLRVVQFDSLPPERELERIGAFIERNPHVEIRAYGGYDGSITDVEFLRHFGAARRVSVDALWELRSLDGLRHLGDHLERLGLGRTRRRFSMAPLARFRALRVLFLEGHGKDIEAISELRRLEDLRRRSLDIKLGGTTDLRPLSEMRQIEYLELWMIKGFDDLSEISGLTQLRYLFLQALRRVTALPDFSRCAKLERIHLETMKGLTDLHVVDMPQLRWEHVEVLRDDPTLQRLRLGTGSMKRNEEYRSRLGYPDTEAPSDELLRLSRGDP